MFYFMYFCFHVQNLRDISQQANSVHAMSKRCMLIKHNISINCNKIGPRARKRA